MRHAYWCEHAWLPPGTAQPGVRIELEDGRIRAVLTGVEPRPDDVRLPGLTLPGLANAHSHAFHRALRGRTQHGLGSFWSWREAMYDLAGALDPDGYRRLARRTYAEMRAVGVSRVGEFHYLHHDPEGRPYQDPNAFGHALIAAAREAGIRITLLDTCYLAGGFGEPVQGVQRRFSDGTVQRWAERVELLHQQYADAPDVTVGAAIHSVRAVPAEAMPRVAAWATERNVPLHVHLSEQPRENADCVRAHGVTPTRLLYEQGVLGPGTTVVHGTHLTEDDVRLLSGAGATVVFCPTTEADLADGIGPGPALSEAGTELALGSDSHAVIDLLGEARALEWHERLRSGVRGRWTPSELLRIATENGHRALGHADAGMLVAGASADLVTLAIPTEPGEDVRSVNGPATAPSVPAGPALDPDQLAGSAVFASGPADIRRVLVAGSNA